MDRIKKSGHDYTWESEANSYVHRIRECEKCSADIKQLESEKLLGK